MNINENHVTLLARAFENDPLFIFLFSTKNMDQSKTLIRFIIKRNRLLNGLILTDHLKTPGYVALLDRPVNLRKVSMFAIIRLNIEMFLMIFKLPLRMLRFLSAYFDQTSSSAPVEPHYYLTMIGVDPIAQGKGLGKKVLNEIHMIVDSSSPPYPIALDTENPKNIAYYESFGYELIDSKLIEGLQVFCMTRPLR